MTSIMEKLAENKAKAQKLQSTLDKVAPNKEQPPNQPGDWSRARYGAMFMQYKTVAVLLAECYAMLDGLQREIQRLEAHVAKMDIRMDGFEEKSNAGRSLDTNADSEVYDGDIPEEEELTYEVPVDPNHEFNKVINGELPTDNGVAVLEEIDLLS